MGASGGSSNGAAGGWVLEGGVLRPTNSGDNVGIGTDSPNAKLDVRGIPGAIVGGFASGSFHVTSPSALVNANAVITGHNSFGGNKQLWYFGSTASGNDDIALINRQNASLSFWTNNLMNNNCSPYHTEDWNSYTLWQISCSSNNYYTTGFYTWVVIVSYHQMGLNPHSDRPSVARFQFLEPYFLW